MKKYTWKQIKKENGVYKTFFEEGYPAIGSQFGLYDFHSDGGEITVLTDKGIEECNSEDYWGDEIFAKIKG